VTRLYRDGDREIRACDGVDLELVRGEFAALAGPSGSGKTTLLNLIGGLDRPDEGTVEIDGESTRDLGDEGLTKLRLHKVGFVFQAYNLIPVLSALENAEFVLLVQGVPPAERRRRVAEVFTELGLAGLEDRRPTQLSGGQQQRVAVARAVAARPAIVLADEPTANLDSTTAENLLDMMHRLNHELGITFLFSSHDPLVLERADRLIRMRDGRVVADEVRRPIAHREA
jgi:putative ABC transport system ATP-binding protein